MTQETDPSSSISSFVIRALDFGRNGAVDGVVTVPNPISGKPTGVLADRMDCPETKQGVRDGIM